MVEQGIADWLIDYSVDPPRLSWDIVLRYRSVKTPRAHTLESYNPVRAPRAFGHIERTIDFGMSDGGRCMNWVERAADGETEERELFNAYFDSEMNVRYELFGERGPDLKRLKEISDTFGVQKGKAAIHLDRDIFHAADVIKQQGLKKDLSKDCPVLSFIGVDQRTK